jgi:aspartyl protease family protein
MSKAVYLILGGVFVVAMLSPSQRDAPKSTPVVAPMAAPQPVAPMNGGDFTLTRAPDGHFYTDAQVNGTIIRFLVDTGATTVALTKTDAAKIGLQFTDADFTETGEGAGGKIALKPVMLDRIIIGTTDAANVEAAIINSPMRTSLLGQSWLRRVGTVEIKGDRMVLK